MLTLSSEAIQFALGLQWDDPKKRNSLMGAVQRTSPELSLAVEEMWNRINTLELDGRDAFDVAATFMFHVFQANKDFGTPDELVGLATGIGNVE